MQKITRYGAYGVLLKENKLLLTQKKAGPYAELWGLPGGQVEFGESPEEALKRELTEETALETDSIELFTIAVANGTYKNNEGPYQFHQIGIVYRIIEARIAIGVVPEELVRWVELSQIRRKELTPFANSVFLLLRDL
jgi:mutator protein MutT